MDNRNRTIPKGLGVMCLYGGKMSYDRHWGLERVACRSFRIG